MRKSILLAAALCAAAGSLFGQSGSVPAGERTSVELTIYNQNLSLVREERTIAVTEGLSRVVVSDIPATIDGTSLHFLSLTAPQAVKVLEQDYQYDLVNEGTLLNRYLGREVEFVRLNELTKKEYTVTGRLLATGWPARSGSARPTGALSSDGMVAEISGKIELNPDGRLILPSLPEGLIVKPRLEWLVTSTRAGEHRTEISYLAGQLSWTCDYIALLAPDEAHLDLTGWVTLTNNSGTSFKNAGLKLLAGDVNLVRQELRGVFTTSSTQTVASHPQFKQTELFEYKLYTLQRRTDLNNRETKQIELTSGKDVPTKKVLIYDALGGSWRSWSNNSSDRIQGSIGRQSDQKVGVFLTFRNDERSDLGMPLPKGKVRVYKRDEEGKEELIGEDVMDHTPKDEEIGLYLGNAFDVAAERVQKDFKVTSSGHTVTETIEIRLRNHKSDSVEVQVCEHPWRWSGWEITKTDAEYVKVDQSTVKFPVKLAKDEEKVITYTVQYSW